MHAFKIYSAHDAKPPSDCMWIAGIADPSPSLPEFVKHAWQTGRHHQTA